jgi:RecB family endonuclease NucS
VHQRDEERNVVAGGEAAGEGHGGANVALPSPAVRVLVCRCTIGYAGRLTTRLASGDRVVLFKEDGSVAVHALKGAKPINYMAGPTSLREEDAVIRIYRPASDETLTIVVEQVHHDARHALSDDALLEREGQERELHEHLARAPHLIETGLAVVERERLTDVGPVDLWCRDADGRVTLVEVKRVRAIAAAVEQVVRYREQAQRNVALGPIRALVVAPDFAPQAKVLAEARDVECIVLDVPRLLAEAGPDDLTLFP